MTTAFELLHRSVQQKLWEMDWKELRPIQAKSIRHLLLSTGDCVISSPTASGKTEAAFLPVLSAIADAPGGSVRAMYIGPLKALINDQFRRLEDLCERMEMPVHKWHGDIDATARRALLDAPSGVLLITPESLEAMFVLRPAQIPRIFARLSYVVIDELHAFLESERGAQLRSLLHRLRLRAGCDPVRIGLSATIGDPQRALAWLRPGGALATAITSEGAEPPLALRVKGLWRDRREDEKEANSEHDARDPSLTELARGILLACRGRTNLVFANAKAQIEALADELTTQATAMSLPDEIVVHHGSLSKEKREYAEARLRREAPCTAVCSNTLEMGIDIGEISDVVQVSAPWSVASLKQRLGRSGRRADTRRVLRGYFVEDRRTEKTSFWEGLHLPFLQGIATIELLLSGFLEPPATDRSHLSTLVHQILSALAETGGVTAAVLHERTVASGAFGAVSRRDFATLLRELGRRELIEQMPEGTLVVGTEGLKLVEHYTFYAAFNAPSELRVVCGSEDIGTIAMAPPPGEHLILAGRRWRVEQVDPGRREVLVSRAHGRRPPWYQSRGGTIHRRIHEKMRDLLSDTSEPTYLDETAREILASGRAVAAQCHWFRPRAQPFEGGVRLFVWKGTRAQQTLAIALSIAGLPYRDEVVGFDVEADSTDLRRLLEIVARGANGGALAAFADEKMRLRELGREKFEPFLPSDLWRETFVRDQLDLSGAAEAASELANSLVTPLSKISTPSASGTRTISGEESARSAARSGLDSALLRPLVGLRFDGPTLSENDPPLGTAHIGRPVWGPAALLGELELRLGLASPRALAEERLQCWARRLKELDGIAARFYSNSLRVDPLGTASALLAWRDELVEAGWDGQAVVAAGQRLATLMELETGLKLPAGTGDRLRRVEEAIGRAPSSPLDAVQLADARTLWPGRWQRVFVLLEERGTDIAFVEPTFPHNPADTDLACVQALLRGQSVRGGLRGDGTLVLLRGESSWEAAHATAALVASWNQPDTVVVRSGDTNALDFAFEAQGLPTQGVAERTVWRPPLQVLPLAIELAFEPRDPYRLLELLTLPVGPFQGIVGERLAAALAKAPGVGGPSWNYAKEKAAEALRGSVAESVVAERMGRVAEWLEQPGHDAGTGAPKSALLEVAQRVLLWLETRSALAGAARADASVLLIAAVSQAHAFIRLLKEDAREVLDLVETRFLLEHVSHGSVVRTTIERAERIDHVSSPAGLRRARGVVVWWHCVAGSEWRPRAQTWREVELEALRAAGILFANVNDRLSAESHSWRQVVLAAKERLVLVVPRFSNGEPQEPHPIWDEILARVAADDEDETRVTVNARDLVKGHLGPLRHWPAPGIAGYDTLRLPDGRPEWALPPLVLDPKASYSASSLETLVGCPLRWVLRERAHLRPSSIASIPSGPRLYGTLAHRVVEELFRSGAFEREQELSGDIHALLQRLVRQEAAVLLRPGMSFELAQLQQQMVGNIRKLAHLLSTSNLTIVGVEMPTDGPWRDGRLVGRMDVLLRDQLGRDVILDLKWGRRTYADLLKQGLAIQLAVYAKARAVETGALDVPVAAYFALSRGTLLATDPRPFAESVPIKGPSILETWTSLERTVALVERLFEQGRVPVTGVPKSLPLLQAAGLAPESWGAHLNQQPKSQCGNCSYDPLCGRRWGDFA